MNPVKELTVDKLPGDLNHVTLSEVMGLMKGDASGRVQR